MGLRRDAILGVGVGLFVQFVAVFVAPWLTPRIRETRLVMNWPEGVPENFPPLQRKGQAQYWQSSWTLARDVEVLTVSPTRDEGSREVVEYAAETVRVGIPFRCAYGTKFEHRTIVLQGLRQANLTVHSSDDSAWLILRENTSYYGVDHDIIFPKRIVWTGLVINLICGGVAFACLGAGVRRGHQWVVRLRRRKGRCVCGYDLSGLLSDRCPECARFIPRDTGD